MINLAASAKRHGEDIAAVSAQRVDLAAVGGIVDFDQAGRSAPGHQPARGRQRRRMDDAVTGARDYVREAITEGLPLGRGTGPVNPPGSAV